MDDSGLTRRDVLKTSFLGAAALDLPWQVTLTAKGKSRIDRKLLPRPFTVPFAVPPVLRPVRTDATTDYYRIPTASRASSTVASTYRWARSSC